LRYAFFARVGFFDFFTLIPSMVYAYAHD
jgi:hypothetical protein